MAGAQNIGESSDNPVAINVTAMVDVIFCLCLFFMCSFHFKQLEGKVDTYLPKKAGALPKPVETFELEPIRVLLRWDPGTNTTIRQVGNRGAVSSDRELVQGILQMASDYKRLDKTDLTVLIDATAEIPWKEAVKVMDLCKRENLERIEFAASYEPLGAAVVPKKN